MQPMTKTQTDRSAQPPTLADYLAILRRRKWVIIVALVLVPATAFLISVRQPALYQASADVLLSRQNLGSQLTGIQDPAVYQDPARFAQTQADIARSPEVSERAAEKLGSDTALGGYSVSPKANADVLSFTVSAARPRERCPAR